MSTISQRAIGVQDLPENDRPISEEFRLAAKEWVEKEKAASLYEETKSSVLSQMMLRLGICPCLGRR